MRVFPHYLEAVGVPVVSKKGQAPMHTFEVSASGMLAEVPLMKTRHKTKLKTKSWRKRLHLLTGKVVKSHRKRPCIQGSMNKYEATRCCTNLLIPPRGRVKRGSYLRIDRSSVADRRGLTPSVNGFPWVFPLLRVSSSCSSLPFGDFGNCFQVEGGSKMRVELVKEKNGTRHDEQTEADCIAILLSALGQRAQSKSEYF